MEAVARVTALCITGAVVSLLIRRGDGAMALTLTAAVTVAAALYLWEPVRELLELLGEMGEKSGLSPAVLLPLYKTAGIALVVRLGGDLCRDAGESALASVVEAAGAVCALLATLPLLREILDMLSGLMG